MEKPIPPNPDTMTDEEFDKWLEAEFIWESEQIEKALFPDGIPEDTSTPEEKEAAWQKFVAKAKENPIRRKLSGIYTHSFYRSIPYEYKKGDELTKTGKPKKTKGGNIYERNNNRTRARLLYSASGSL